MGLFMTSDSTPDKETAFYSWVGLYITRWAFIEETLFLICSTVLGTDPARTAVVFYRTPTLSSRIELISELMTVRFPPPERANGGHRDKRYKAWERLAQKLKALMPMRNSVAHHPVIWRGGVECKIETQADGSQVVRVDASTQTYRYELYKSHTKRLRERDAEEENVTLEDLRLNYQKVDSLYRSLVDYWRTLAPP